MLIAVQRRVRRWRGRLALAWGLLALGAVIAVMHVPAGQMDGMGASEHVDGAALCLGILGAGVALAVAIGVIAARRPRPPRHLGNGNFSMWRPGPPAPPARAGPLALQVLRL